MKKLIAISFVVILLVVTFMVTPSVVKADDCKGNSCIVITTPHCGEVGPSGLKLCSKEIPAGNNKGFGNGYFSGRRPIPTSIQEVSEPKPTGYLPQLFHSRSANCVKTLSCKIFFGNGKNGQ